MIATFSKEGRPYPYRFRLVAEDETFIVVNIDKILFMEENKRENIIKFRCNCIINDTKRTVDIYFYKMSAKWYMLN